LKTLVLIVIGLMPIFSGWWLLIPLTVLIFLLRERPIPAIKTCLGGFWLILWISILVSTGLKTGFAAFAQFSIPVILAWLISVTYSEKFCRLIIKTLVFSSLVWMMIGFAQHYSGMATPWSWLDPSQRIWITTRSYAVFVNPNIYALYLLSILVFSFYLMKNEESRLCRVGAGVITILGLVSLYCTFSRIAWLIALAFLLIWPWPMFGRRKWLVLCVGLLGLASLTGARIRMAGLFYLHDSSLAYRLQIWKGTLKAIGAHWLWGAGPGGFQNLYPVYRDANIPSNHAHQFYLQLWLEYGLFSLLTFIWLMKKNFQRWSIRWRELKNPAAIVVFCFLISGLSESWQTVPFIAGYFWLIFGLANSFAVGQSKTS
jgi:O-antigen ligase